MQNHHALKQELQKSRGHFGEWVIERIITLFGLSAVIFVLAIFVFIAKEALGMFGHDFSFFSFFTSSKWHPEAIGGGDAYFGALALITGTLCVTLGSMMIAVPIGLGCALFISEYCSPKARDIAKTIIEFLAAIPSVVWGFMAISLLNPLIINTFQVPIGLNILNASAILALMSIPIIVSMSEDALRAVPESYRDAALALGATKLEMIKKVLLPASKNGLMAAALLGVGRSLGETMAVLMASGHSVNMPSSVFDPVRTMTATIAAEMGETAKGSEHYQVLFFMGLLLFIVSFVINTLANRLIRKKSKG